jgi:hypothetical protein
MYVMYINELFYIITYLVQINAFLYDQYDRKKKVDLGLKTRHNVIQKNGGTLKL